MASHSQLKYGARLINSFLGNNSTISCCEVLNSLIFPAHEQHHNNSFLCAALVMGQSNIAAGATIGSNHNSRAADGEMVAARGFWPGLCVSLKHNSKFATFTLIAKGDYSSELNIPLPFSLVSNDEANNCLLVMPAYWFLYNLYALARNSGKYVERDKRIDKTQNIEYDFLAPDSVNEIFSGLDLLRKFTAMALNPGFDSETPGDILLSEGEAALNNPEIDLKKITVRAYGFENNSRPVKLLKVKEAYTVYKDLIIYYGITRLIHFIEKNKPVSFEALLQSLDQKPGRSPWENVGGQLLPKSSLDRLLQGIKNNSISTWDAVHEFYETEGNAYADQKLQHAYASLLEVLQIKPAQLNKALLKELLQRALSIKEGMISNIIDSREKDYQSEFRKMLYDNEAEMEKVIGKLDDNIFIAQQKEELERFKISVKNIGRQFGL
jgi:hypothetical protein